MTPKEKAKELFERFENAVYNYFTNTGDGVEVVMLAKQSALIAVDEILNSGIHVEFYFDNSVGYMLSYDEYYEEVKQEIEKL